MEIDLFAKQMVVISVHKGREGDALVTVEGCVAKKKVVRSMHKVREEGALPTVGSKRYDIVKKKVVISIQ